MVGQITLSEKQLQLAQKYKPKTIGHIALSENQKQIAQKYKPDNTTSLNSTDSLSSNTARNGGVSSRDSDRDNFDARVRNNYLNKEIEKTTAELAASPDDENLKAKQSRLNAQQAKYEVDRSLSAVQTQVSSLDDQIKEVEKKHNLSEPMGGTVRGTHGAYVKQSENPYDKELAQLKSERDALLQTYYDLENTAQFTALEQDKTASQTYSEAKALESDMAVISQVMAEYPYNTGNLSGAELAEKQKYLENKYGITQKAINNYISGGDDYDDGNGNIMMTYSRLSTELQQKKDSLKSSSYDYDRMTGYEDRQAQAKDAAEAKAEAEQFAKESPVLASATTVLAAPFQGVDYLTTSLSTVGHNDTSDLDNYVPANSDGMGITNYVSAVRKQVSSDIEKNTDWTVFGQNVGSFLYNTGMSLADSAVQIAAFGSASVYVMGASAAAQQQKQILDNGGTNSQAFLGGLAAGTAEAVFEKISVGKLLEPRSVNSVKSLIGKTFEQAGVEASSEMASQVANILSDAAIMGQSSQYNTAVKYYIDHGDTEERAKQKAFIDMVGQVAQAGVGGFISGGIMGGVVNGYNYTKSTGINGIGANVPEVDIAAPQSPDTAKAPAARGSKSDAQVIYDTVSQGKAEAEARRQSSIDFPGHQSSGTSLPQNGKTPKLADLFRNIVEDKKATKRQGVLDYLDGEINKRQQLTEPETSLPPQEPQLTDSGNEGIIDGKAITEGAGDVKYYRVQTPAENGSMERIIVNDDGTIKITTPNTSLNLSYGTPEHAQYFKTLKGGDSYIVEFDVDDWFHNFVQENAIPQRNYRSNPLNQGMTAPKIVDETTPGNSLEFPSIWNKWFEEYAKNGRILK